jgi:quercetin dioxygenase-like cupin family protein
VSRYGSDFTISRLFHSAELHAGCMRLGPGGLIGLHEASGPQLLAVVEGEGWIRGKGPERTPISAGGAVFWEKGEWHETGTDTGLVALVIESPHLIDDDAIGPITPEQRIKPALSPRGKP